MLLSTAPHLARAGGPAPDVSAVKDKFKVVSDGKEHFVAFVPFNRDDDRVFYGDGKTFHSLPVQGGGSTGDTAFDVVFVDPRHPAGFQREFHFKDGKYDVQCGERTTALTLIDDKAAKAMVASAKFLPSPRKTRAYALARDDQGRYFFVDTGRTPDTEKAFRLFMGPKGNLKLQKMTNVVSDSEGDIFSTKTGSLRLILNKNESVWIEGKKQKKLVLVPVEDNARMIYTELGVYTGERLGTPCDDF
jgi:hypothetical protein